jgi:hypothetical protein
MPMVAFSTDVSALDLDGSKRGSLSDEMPCSVCYLEDDKLDCIQGCPDPFDSCQYAGDGGICEFGYAACLQKFGCSGQSGQADCIGLATGKFSRMISALKACGFFTSIEL